MKKRKQLEMFGDILGDFLGVNELEFLDPEERKARERKLKEKKTIHIMIHEDKKQKTP